MFTGTLKGCAFCPRACRQYFVYRRNFYRPHAYVYRVHYIIIWGKGGPGFLTLFCRQLSDVPALHRRTSEDCDKIPIHDCSTLFYTQCEKQIETGLKKTGFKKKTSPVGFLFLQDFWFFFGFLYIFAQKREFQGFFSFKNTFRCIQTLN